MTSKVAETNLDEGILNNSEWIHRWAVGNTPFHQSTYDKYLDEREEEMFGGKTKSIFMPLCGKTFDILWMYKRGHTVCGVEIAEQPIREFFEENEIDFEIQAIENVGTLYKSKDGRLNLYIADIFDVSRELCGQHDVIWDRRSLGAINVDDHQLYRDLLLSLIKDNGQYYLATVDYDPSIWPGPPHTMPDKAVKDIFGDFYDIELLEVKERVLPEKNGSEADEGKPLSNPKSFHEALMASSYVYDRRYKMTLKQPSK